MVTIKDISVPPNNTTQSTLRHYCYQKTCLLISISTGPTQVKHHPQEYYSESPSGTCTCNLQIIREYLQSVFSLVTYFQCSSRMIIIDVFLWQCSLQNCINAIYSFCNTSIQKKFMIQKVWNSVQQCTILEDLSVPSILKKIIASLWHSVPWKHICPCWIFPCIPYLS